MLVLDTRSPAAGARAEAFPATVSARCSSSTASFEDSHVAWNRQERPFGPRTLVVSAAGDGRHLIATRSPAARAGPAPDG